MRHVFVSLVFGLLACSGSRQDPPIGEDVLGPPEGGSTSTDSSTGTEGTGATTGTGGAPLGGQGPGPGAELYPHCGCVIDANTAGACRTCFLDAELAPDCSEIQAGCADNPDCALALEELQGCIDTDPACFDAVALAHPNSFDDLTALVSCRCGLCEFCDTDSCQ